MKTDKPANTPKPCPFCGSEPSVKYDDLSESWEIKCPETAWKCPVVASMDAADKEEAIAAWNRRPSPAPVEGVPPEVQEALAVPEDVIRGHKGDGNDFLEWDHIALRAFLAAMYSKHRVLASFVRRLLAENEGLKEYSGDIKRAASGAVGLTIKAQRERDEALAELSALKSAVAPPMSRDMAWAVLGCSCLGFKGTHYANSCPFKTPVPVAPPEDEKNAARKELHAVEKIYRDSVNNHEFPIKLFDYITRRYEELKP